MGTELQFCKLKSSADCLNNMNVLNITGYLKMVKMISFTCVLPQFFLKSTISFLRYLCAFDLCKFNRRQINAPYLELIFLASLPIQTKLLPLESPKKELPHPPFLFSLWAKHLYLNLYARRCSAVSLILFLLYLIVEEMKALARSREKGLAPRPHKALRKYFMHELMKKIMRAPTFLVLSYQCTHKKIFVLTWNMCLG